MKKIVLTIIALVCFINVNAQRVEMNYENTFEPIFEVRNISARGTANITLNYSDVIVSINCTGFTEFSNKGVVIDDDHNCLEFAGDIEEEGAATFTVSLSDNAKQANKYIKKITFITRGNSDITSVIGSNDAGSDTDVKFVGTNRIVVEDGYSAISTFEIDFTYSDYIQLKSIIVEYGYFDDDLWVLLQSKVWRQKLHDYIVEHKLTDDSWLGKIAAEGLGAIAALLLAA